MTIPSFFEAREIAKRIGTHAAHPLDEMRLLAFVDWAQDELARRSDLPAYADVIARDAYLAGASSIADMVMGLDMPMETVGAIHRKVQQATGHLEGAKKRARGRTEAPDRMHVGVDLAEPGTESKSVVVVFSNIERDVLKGWALALPPVLDSLRSFLLGAAAGVPVVTPSAFDSGVEAAVQAVEKRCAQMNQDARIADENGQTRLASVKYRMAAALYRAACAIPADVAKAQTPPAEVA